MMGKPEGDRDAEEEQGQEEYYIPYIRCPGLRQVGEGGCERKRARLEEGKRLEGSLVLVDGLLSVRCRCGEGQLDEAGASPSLARLDSAGGGRARAGTSIT